MFDPEAFIVKGGILALAALSVIRLVLQDFNNLVTDFRKAKMPLIQSNQQDKTTAPK
jgi:hypothetical protein